MRNSVHHDGATRTFVPKRGHRIKTIESRQLNRDIELNFRAGRFFIRPRKRIGANQRPARDTIGCRSCVKLQQLYRAI
jgi:hypothetical protein